ncbi:hypothetical protein WA026_016476 [Henosepilachna vigintioctopunctata]|uniref:Uncharacterized protein n=1 Tax=Henosepilachna vigintioctopunctata TaxID=420089 RepID=A0AAW1UGE2_9CUCU
MRKCLSRPTKKQGRQSAIESLFKATHNPITAIIENSSSTQSSKLQKQNSISGYPIQIQVEEYNDCTISRDRPATICVDKIEQNLGTAALALERPRKSCLFKNQNTFLGKFLQL